MAAALLLSSCIYDKVQEERRVPVRATTSTVTRATDDLYISMFDGGENIELYMDDGSTTTNSTYTVSTTDHTTLSGGSLSYPSGSSGSVTLYGVYPSGSTARHTVCYDQTSDANYKASDLMYTTKTVALADKGNIQSLTFSHQLVKLKLVIKKSRDIYQVTGVKMANVKRTVPVTADGTSMSVGTAVATTSSDNADHTYGNFILISNGETGAYTQQNFTYACVFPAQPWAGTNFIEVEADGQTAAFQLTRNVWIPGNEYEVTLNVGLMNLGATVAITDWSDGGDCTIHPTSSSGGTLLVDPVTSDCKYTGSAFEPKPTVSFNGTPLTEGTDFDFSWYNNVEVGSGMIMALGRNGTSYVGQLGFRSFYISQADGTVSFTNATATTYFSSGGSFPSTRNPIVITGDGTPSYTSSNTAVATVNSSTGDVTMVSPGTTVITATMTDGPHYAYSPSTASYTLTIDPRPKLPIEYIAPYNMGTATAFAANNYASSSMYFYWGTTSAPTANMKAFINGTAVAGYHLPSKAEWCSIIAPYYAGSNDTSMGGSDGQRIYYKQGQHTGLTETVAWGVTNNNTNSTWSANNYAYEVNQVFYNDYNCPNDAVHTYIGYGLRFKPTASTNGEYTCGYRYEYKTADASVGGGASLTVMVKYVGSDQSVSITTVSNESWWASPDFTVVIPACGHKGNNSRDYAAGNYSSASSPAYGYYWSATVRDASYVHNMLFLTSYVIGNDWIHPGYGFSVRLFADK